MVIAATASEELRHGSVSGTPGFVELARAAGEGDFIFDYRGVAVANIDLGNVRGRSSAERARQRPITRRKGDQEKDRTLSDETDLKP